MALNKFNHVKIKAIQAVLPKNIKNIDYEKQYYKDEFRFERFKKILGLGTRRVVDDKTTCCDLIEFAAIKLIEKENLDKDTIDTLIVVSTSHDFRSPASSCILQGRLGFTEDCTCFDLSGLGCSAYVHGLFTAHSLIASGASKRVLLLVGDTISEHTNEKDRNTSILFGDAASATLLEYTDDEITNYFYTGTRGQGYDNLISPAGGSYLPIEKDIVDLSIEDNSGNVRYLYHDYMNGMEVFKFSAEVGPLGIKKILDYSNNTIDTVDYFAIHQANKQIVNTVARFASLPKEKYSASAFETYGNTGTCAIVTDIVHNLHDKEIKKLGLASFGIGLSWGFAVLDTNGTVIYDFDELPNNFNDNRHEQGLGLTRQERIDYWVKKTSVIENK
jgi:3-oxoacyl-[acyl-carrier-protein] synthase-3